MEIETTYCLWGKKGSNGEASWLPLIMHLADTVEIGKRLWDEWLCEGAKRNIAANCTYSGSPDEAEKLRQARALFVFLCASHDLGKATPAFQTKEAKPCYAGLSDQQERDERACKCCDLDDVILRILMRAGFLCPEALPERVKTPHALCSQVILLQLAGQAVSNIASILGAHHGMPQQTGIKTSLLDAYPRNFYAGKDGKPAWTEAQSALLQWAQKMAGFESPAQLPSPNLVASVELSGLLVMADWISSNEWLFPYLYTDEVVDVSQCLMRAKRAYSKLALTHPWEPLSDLSFTNDLHDYYLHRFGFATPNILQQRMIDIAQSMQKPGILVVEAPMGYGKTETALAASEILARKTGRTGVFFALPTQATSNGIFPRLLSWIDNFNDSRCHSVKLFHSKAEFNEDWRGLTDALERRRDGMIKDIQGNGQEDEDDDTVIVNDWFSGRKKSMLADFVIGTVDQLLMGAFKHKHLMLRHLGLANKVIIIDECHAYDAYMSVYLERILEWLGKYQIPTIVLSATLPCGKRASLVNAYTNQKLPAVKNNSDAMFFDIEEEEDVATPEWMTTRAYPLITYSDGEEIRSEMIPREETRREVKICRIDDEALQNSIAQLLADGGCAGIIVNSVARAQTLYRALRERFGTNNVLLFHSRFVMPDRATIEKEVTRLLGKPGKQTQRPTFKIVIGTQVLEQSLDIDFDVLYTDIAPMDLLIQRMGRLHRHTRTRPRHLASPVCYVMGIYENNTFHRAAIAVYGNYLLMRTLALLPETIVLPDNISQLVDDVYNENCEIDGMPQERYAEAKKQYLKIIKNKQKLVIKKFNLIKLICSWVN